MEEPRRNRRSLSQQRGQLRLGGDKEVSAQLGKALKVPRDADSRRGTQGFHPWPGRMHPHTAGVLVRLVPEGALIADPYMGGGTVVTEAFLAGRAAYGAELNPVGVDVAWARTRQWSKPRLKALMETAAACVSGCREFRQEHNRVPDHFFQSEGEWYDPPALMEVWGLREAIRKLQDEELRRMARICLSSILVKVSRQATDSVTRPDREHRWIPKRRVEDLFLRRVGEHTEALGRLNSSVKSSLEPLLVMADAGMGLRLGDARAAAVISSPPYPGTYDYVEHHRRRYEALGFDPSLAMQAEIGSRRRQKEVGGDRATTEYEAALVRAMKSWFPRVTDDGRVFLVLGDGQSKQGIVPVEKIVRNVALKSGWRIEAWAGQPRDIRGAVGRGSRGRKMEFIFALEKQVKTK